MPRNLDRRIELLVPIEDPACKEKFACVLDAALADTVKAREMTAAGTYLPPAVATSRDATKAEPVRSQYRLYQEALALRPTSIRQVQFQPHVPVSRSKARKGKKSGKSNR